MTVRLRRLLTGGVAFTPMAAALATERFFLTREELADAAWLADLFTALGAKLASPDKFVIGTYGDGSYMFGNPLPYHFMQKAENLATLTIIANNSSWHAVRSATLHLYPDGKAANANQMPLTELTPSPAYEKTIETIGGLGMRVENPDDLMEALKKGLEAVRSGRPALVNVITEARA